MIIVTHEMDFAANISHRVLYMDEGGIYEEGPPEQIFKHPLKEKTKAFILRIRSLDIHVTSSKYDLYGIQAQIKTFCEKHLLPPRVSDFAQHLAEEVLLLIRDYSDVQIRLSYSERDESLQFAFDSAGEEHNSLTAKAEPDDIGVKIILERSKHTEYSYQDGRNILKVVIQGENTK